MNMLLCSAKDRSAAQENFDAIGCPRRNSTSEEVRIFGPDRETKSKCGRQNGPIFQIASAKSLPRLGLVIAVKIRSD